MDQRIRTTRTRDGVAVAYGRAGHGPPLILVSGWLSHLELSWALPSERRFLEALADGRTLVRYDRPGCGLSGETATPGAMNVELDALAAVAEAVRAATGSERADVLGTSFGAAVATSWAVTRPERVRRLVLYGGWVRGQDIASVAVREHVLALVAGEWGLGSDVLTDIFAPDASRADRAAFARYQRECAPAETARSLLAASYAVDLGALLPAVAAPTLVVHRERDRAAPVDQGRLLANGIPGARLEVVPGRSHLPHIGDPDPVLESIRRFLGLPLSRRHTPPTVTPRQLEVAALVAEGATNREIAARLSIAERSAESHVERIRERLGFHSRAQIAAWFVATRGAD